MVGKNSEQTFSFEIISCLLAALSESGAVVGSKHYSLMAQIDGTRTQSGYEHMFRAVKARAREIKEQIDKGELGTQKDASTPKGPKTKTSKTATPASGVTKSNKRGRKAKKVEAQESSDSDDSETPTKKAKTEQVMEDDYELV